MRSPLRFLTYNVRRFTDNEGSSSVAPVAAILRSLKPDVVCLNEVDLNLRPTCLTDLTTIDDGDDDNSNFQLKYHFYGHVKNGKYGNAILWNSNSVEQYIKHSSDSGSNNNIIEEQLPGGSKIIVPAGTRLLNGDITENERTHQIMRGLVGIQLRRRRRKEEEEGKELSLCPSDDNDNNLDNKFADTNNGDDDSSFWVFCSHLDHISDEERSIQLKFIKEIIHKETTNGNSNADKNNETIPAILMGDLNALTKNDYTVEEWNVLEERARTNNWTAPVDSIALKELLRGEEESTWYDLFEIGTRQQYRDNGSSILGLPPEEKFSAHGIYRIDYLFTNNAFMKKFDRRSIDARICSEAIGASDHFPVIVQVSEEEQSS